jgi:putative transposase
MSDLEKRGRRSVRLPGYDYALPGAYFVTICAYRRKYIFGRVESGQVLLSDIGRIIQSCWTQLPAHFGFVALDVFMIMPNHVHGILEIKNDGRRGKIYRAPTRRFGAANPRSLSTIVRTFKSAVTRICREKKCDSSFRIWQRSYFEHIIRNEQDLNRIRRYIVENPVRWELDRYFVSVPSS